MKYLCELEKKEKNRDDCNEFSSPVIKCSFGSCDTSGSNATHRRESLTDS